MNETPQPLPGPAPPIRRLLPPSLRRPEAVAALLSAVPALAVYLCTVCPTVSGGDAGDLSTASWTLGISHPPGYPLYMLLGKVLATILPVGEVALRYGLLSALAGAAAIGVVGALCAFVTGDVVASVVAAWTLAFSAAWWSQCVVPEVYSLNGLLLGSILLLLLRWGERGDARGLFLAAYLYGLGMAHHITLAMAAPAVAAYVVSRVRTAPFRVAWLPALAGLLAVGPLLYVYLILRARLGPAYNFGNPSSWERFLYYVQAKAYYFRLVGVGTPMWTRRMLSVGQVLVEELGWAGTLAALAGFVLLLKRWRLAMLVGLLALAYAAYDAAYRIPDIRVYYLPILLAFTPLVAVSIAALRRWAAERLRTSGPAAATAACAALLPALLLWANWGADDFHDARLLRGWVDSLHDICTLHGTRPARLMLLGDNELFCTAYIKLVERRHPELEVVDQVGNLFGDVYGVRGFNGVRDLHTIQDETRWEREDSLLLRSPLPTFYNWRPDYELKHFKFVQRGPLFQAVARAAADTIPTGREWKFLPDLAPYERRARLDVDSRHVLATYYTLHGLDAYTAGRTAAAEGDWNRAQGFASDFVDVHQALSTFFLTVGQKSRALAECQRTVDLLPDEGAGYGNFGDVLLACGDTAKAVQMYEKGMQVSGYLSTRQYGTIAAVLQAEGRPEEAIQYYRYSLSEQPRDPAGWLSLGYAYMKQNDLADAETCIRKALELNPDAAAHGAMGLIDLARGQMSESAREWQAALQRSPGYPGAHFHLGLVREASGDWAGAAAEYREELRLHDTDTRALEKLGLCLSRLGRVDEAAGAWERAVAIDADDIRTHLNLGVYYERSGNLARSGAHYREVLRIQQQGEMAERARAGLAREGAR